MARAKRTRAKRAKKKVVRRPMRTNKPSRIVKSPGMQVDKAVRDYIALLKDPCNGPLVGPVGATANGYITRFETTKVVNTVNSFWWLRWAPGALNFTGANQTGLAGKQATSGTAAMTDVLTNDEAPGYNYLNANARTFRCLAACAQIMYNNTELNRQGLIGSTITTASRDTANVDEAFSITVDRTRIPDNKLEVLWQPNDGDQYFTNVQTATVDEGIQTTRNAIWLAGTNCYGGSVTVRMVVVYQWTPGTDDTIIQPVPTPGTGMTMASVLMAAKNAGFTAGRFIAAYASGGLYGVAREASLVIRAATRNMR